ncbi:hypothetical protein BH09BAC3_BH09BAC3_01810 [soil metagenome]
MGAELQNFEQTGGEKRDFGVRGKMIGKKCNGTPQFKILYSAYLPHDTKRDLENRGNK